MIWISRTVILRWARLYTLRSCLRLVAGSKKGQQGERSGAWPDSSRSLYSAPTRSQPTQHDHCLHVCVDQYINNKLKIRSLRHAHVSRSLIQFIDFQSCARVSARSCLRYGAAWRWARMKRNKAELLHHSLRYAFAETAETNLATRSKRIPTKHHIC